MRAFNSLDCARDYSTYGFHSGDVRNLQHLRISDAGPYDFYSCGPCVYAAHRKVELHAPPSVIITTICASNCNRLPPVESVSPSGYLE